jgi:hypothetical protein
MSLSRRLEKLESAADAPGQDWRDEPRRQHPVNTDPDYLFQVISGLAQCGALDVAEADPPSDPKLAPVVEMVREIFHIPPHVTLREAFSEVRS